ncbi:uncharacterized protein LOC129744136 isoform X2 [Uranotaenia lowii]|uniref:uncharacterized protein LOC129744136 isoform X2 n=1 Tax=Uranotaenia lowii TaxID=190385 RepID=UPI0024783A66|nr:uncharacterized protein LOC129744136 isoform X2 [Uranotaenia lowii]
MFTSSHFLVIVLALGVTFASPIGSEISDLQRACISMSGSDAGVWKFIASNLEFQSCRESKIGKNDANINFSTFNPGEMEKLCSSLNSSLACLDGMLEGAAMCLGKDDISSAKEKFNQLAVDFLDLMCDGNFNTVDEVANKDCIGDTDDLVKELSHCFATNMLDSESSPDNECLLYAKAIGCVKSKLDKCGGNPQLMKFLYAAVGPALILNNCYDETLSEESVNSSSEIVEEATSETLEIVEPRCNGSAEEQVRQLSECFSLNPLIGKSSSENESPLYSNGLDCDQEITKKCGKSSSENECILYSHGLDCAWKITKICDTPRQLMEILRVVVEPALELNKCYSTTEKEEIAESDEIIEEKVKPDCNRSPDEAVQEIRNCFDFKSIDSSKSSSENECILYSNGLDCMQETIKRCMLLPPVMAELLRNIIEPSLALNNCYDESFDESEENVEADR